ncbi:unnamed protein product [Boreogadus saida]
MEHSQAGIYSGDKNIISRQEWGCQARHRNVFGVEIGLEDSGVTQQQADTTRKAVSRVEELRTNPDVVFRPQLHRHSVNKLMAAVMAAVDKRAASLSPASATRKIEMRDSTLLFFFMVQGYKGFQAFPVIITSYELMGSSAQQNKRRTPIP